MKSCTNQIMRNRSYKIKKVTLNCETVQHIKTVNTHFMHDSVRGYHYLHQYVQFYQREGISELETEDSVKPSRTSPLQSGHTL